MTLRILLPSAANNYRAAVPQVQTCHWYISALYSVTIEHDHVLLTR